jgi:solute carrier family 45 protein 1/2/4
MKTGCGDKVRTMTDIFSLSIVFQLIGAYSDKCTSPLGKRRPYIIFGGVLVCFSMLGVAYAKEIGVLYVRWFSHPQTPEDMVKEVSGFSFHRHCSYISSFTLVFPSF